MSTENPGHGLTVEPVQNDRGEFTLDNGKLYHHAPFDPSTGTGPDTAVHEGAWLTCDGCNPVVTVDVEAMAPAPGGNVTMLEILRGDYAQAKEAADAAAETLKAATAKLKTAITEASNGAYRARLEVPGFRAMNLTYVESWRVNTKRFKAEQPAVYVEYAERSGAWRLEQSKADD